VGKGTKKRPEAHWHGHSKYNALFTRVLTKIRSANLTPIIEIISGFNNEDDAFRLERTLIATFGRRNVGTGTLCNLTDGGEGASGTVISSQTRAKQSAAAKGLPKSTKTRAKMSAYWNTPEGAAVRQEALKKTWEKRRARGTHNGKSVVCLNDGQEFPTIAAAAEHYGIGYSKISAICNKDKKQRMVSTNGLVFRFINDFEGRRDEWQKVIADAAIRSAANRFKGQIAVVCLNDGRQFESAAAAARYYRLSRPKVAGACYNKDIRSVKGLVFRHADDITGLQDDYQSIIAAAKIRSRAGLALGRKPRKKMDI